MNEHPAAPASPDRATTRERVAEIFSASGFRRFFAARTVSQFGDGVFQLAAADVLLFSERTDPALRLLAVTVVVLIPFSAIGPFVGVFIDRWERRKILSRVPLGRAVIAASLPLVSAATGTGSIAFYTVVLVVLSANRFFLATMGAVLPQLVPEDDLIVANSAASTGGSVSNVIGLTAGAALAAVLGGENTAVAAAVAFVASAVLARRVPAQRGFIPERGPLLTELMDVLREMREGARAVRGSPRVVFALTSIGAVQLLVGVTTAVVTQYFIATLGLSVEAATGLLAFLAVGIALGIVAVPAVARRIRYDRLVPMSFVLAGGGALFAASGLSRGRVLAGTAVIGISYAFAKIPVDTIVQEEMPDSFRGRAFALYDMLFNVARVTGVAIAAVVLTGGAREAGLTGTVGAGYFVAAVAFGLWERRLEMRKRKGRDPAPAPPPAAAGLLVAGEMVTVRAYAGARADEEPRAIVIGGTEIPIDRVAWRSVVEDARGRRRIFVVDAAGQRARLAVPDEGGPWEVEGVRPLPAGNP